MLKKIDTRQLRIGMYVTELDRPWSETNFLFQGMQIESEDEVEQIRSLCAYVYIESEDDPVIRNQVREFGLGTESRRAGVDEILGEFVHDCSYPVVATLEQELDHAAQAYHAAASVFHSIWKRIREDRPFSSAEFKPALQKLTGSVLRNPDALLLLRFLCDDRDYNCRHAINTAVLATVFGRHLGFDPEHISVLATGTFLMDIGKARLPEELLHKRGPLKPDEMGRFHCHAETGVQLLRGMSGLLPGVIEIVRSHHERYNGNGYPDGLDGNQIPVLARIAALVDCFDAITIDRPYKRPHAAFEALAMIGEAVDVDFQEQLVKEFVRCMGPYPTGSIVELSNGCHALVIAQNPGDRKQPRVMLLRSGDRQLEDRHIVMDLSRQSASASRPGIEVTAPLPEVLDGARLYARIMSLAAAA